MNGPIPTAIAESGAATRLLLTSQRNQLVFATRPCSEDWAVAKAVRMLARIEAALNDTDWGLHARRGAFGAHGWAPQVESIVRELNYRPSPELARDAPTTQIQKAA